MLQKQKTRIQFTNGLDTKTDDHASDINSGVVRCENARFDKIGVIKKRPGCLSLGVAPTDTTKDSFKSNSLLIDENGSAYTISRERNKTSGKENLDDGWIVSAIDKSSNTYSKIGSYQPVDLEISSAIHTNNIRDAYHGDRDIAYHQGTNYLCTVYNTDSIYSGSFVSIPPKMIITEMSSGVVVYTTDLYYDGTDYGRNVGVVLLGDVFMAYAHSTEAGGTGNLYFTKVDATSLAKTTNYVALPVSHSMDCCDIYHSTYSPTYGRVAVFVTSNLDCIVVNNAGTIVQIITITHATTPKLCVCCSTLKFDYTLDEYVFIGWQDSSTRHMYYVIIKKNGTFQKTETAFDTRFAAWQLVTHITAVAEPAAGLGAGGDESLIKVYYEDWFPYVSYYGTISAPVPYFNNVYTSVIDIHASGGPVGIGPTVFNNCLGSKAFRVGRKAYCWFLHDSGVYYKYTSPASYWTILIPPAQNQYLLKTEIENYTYDAYPTTDPWYVSDYNLTINTEAKITNAGMRMQDAANSKVNRLPAVVVLSGERHLFLCESLDAINTEGQQLVSEVSTNLGGKYLVQSLKLANVCFDVDKPAQRIVTGGNIVLANGNVSMIDGEIKPINFNTCPDALYAWQSYSAGRIGNGSYSYAAIYQARTKTGDLIRSTPSLIGYASTVSIVDTPQSATIKPSDHGSNWDSVLTYYTTGAIGNEWKVSMVTGASESILEDPGAKLTLITYIAGVTTFSILDTLLSSSVYLTITPGTGGSTVVTGTLADVHLDGGSSGLSAIDIRIPMCFECMPDAADGSKSIEIILYRCKDYNTSGVNAFYRVATIQNNLTRSYVDYTDTCDDYSLDFNDPLYTNGGVLENVSPPMSNMMAFDGSRLYAVSMEDRKTIWYTKKKSIGVGFEFSPFLTKYVPDGGEITGIAGMDGKVIVFKRNQVRYFYGDGPDNLGNGEFSSDVIAVSSIGCRGCFVRTDDGIIFQSDKGIHMLTRGLGIDHMGEQVEDWNDIDAIKSVPMRKNEEVRFILENSITQDYYDKDAIWNHQETSFYGTSVHPRGWKSIDGRYTCYAQVVDMKDAVYTNARRVTASVYDNLLEYWVTKNYVIIENKTAALQPQRVQVIWTYNRFIVVVGMLGSSSAGIEANVWGIDDRTFTNAERYPMSLVFGGMHTDLLYDVCVFGEGSHVGNFLIAYKKSTGALYSQYFDTNGTQYGSEFCTIFYEEPIHTEPEVFDYINCQHIHNEVDGNYYTVVMSTILDGVKEAYYNLAIDFNTTPYYDDLVTVDTVNHRIVFGGTWLSAYIEIPYIDGTSYVPVCPEPQTQLVYNYLLKKWSVDTREYSTIDSDFYDKNYFILDSNYNYFPTGKYIQIYKESETAYTDNGTDYDVAVKSGWLTFENINGFGRLWWIYIIGSFPEPYSLLINLYDNTDPDTISEAFTFDTDSDPDSFRIKPMLQKCRSKMVEIIATPKTEGTDLNGCSLFGLDLLYGIYPRLHTTSQAKSK